MWIPIIVPVKIIYRKYTHSPAATRYSKLTSQLIVPLILLTALFGILAAAIQLIWGIVLCGIAWVLLILSKALFIPRRAKKDRAKSIHTMEREWQHRMERKKAETEAASPGGLTSGQDSLITWHRMYLR
ncbi:MAG: hypothetical protein FWF49_01035 [Oscillospiraceae bacterium]|nr:hypothetical protein [Oscillospiraceae bacterium]